MSESKVTYLTLFGTRIRIERTTQSGFYFGLTYTNQDYEHEKQIYIAFLRRMWISWEGKNGTDRSQYGLYVDSSGFKIVYGQNDYFEEKPGKRIQFFWSSITDFFLGKEKRLWDYENNHGMFNLEMYHGDKYRVEITSKQLYGWRPRWFGKKYSLVYNLKPDRGIPHRGKGENSWDCGDDATMEMSCSADSPLDALMEMKRTCENTRNKYGTPKNIQLN